MFSFKKRKDSAPPLPVDKIFISPSSASGASTVSSPHNKDNEKAKKRFSMGFGAKHKEERHERRSLDTSLFISNTTQISVIEERSPVAANTTVQSNTIPIEVNPQKSLSMSHLTIDMSKESTGSDRKLDKKEEKKRKEEEEKKKKEEEKKRKEEEQKRKEEEKVKVVQEKKRKEEEDKKKKDEIKKRNEYCQ